MQRFIISPLSLKRSDVVTQHTINNDRKILILQNVLYLPLADKDFSFVSNLLSGLTEFGLFKLVSLRTIDFLQTFKHRFTAKQKERRV